MQWRGSDHLLDLCNVFVQIQMFAKCCWRQIDVQGQDFCSLETVPALMCLLLL